MRTSFELILEDTSPVINYYPFAETLGVPNLLAGWNSYFSESGFLNELGEIGQGTSLHVTSLDGAELTIQWFGTGISLFGSAFQASYDVSIDGENPFVGDPKGTLLAEIQGLDAEQHIIALIAHPSAIVHNASSYIAFDHATLNVSTNYTGATVSSEFINDTDSSWLFSGDWDQLSNSTLDAEPSQAYHQSITQGNTASIAFTGSAVALTGVRNITSGHYNVTLDGMTTTFDGYSDWLEPSVLFLQAGLGENTRHSLIVTNVDDASLAITGLNITHVNGGSPVTYGSSSSLSTGTIIALVLAGLIAALAIVTLLVCICVRRHRMRDRKPSFSVEPGVRSSTFFHDLTTAWPPTRRHRSKRQSRRSEHVLPIAPTVQPLFTIERRRDVGRVNDNAMVLVTPSRHSTIDPSSPAPYLRLPNTSTSTGGFANHGHDELKGKDKQTESWAHSGYGEYGHDRHDEHPLPQPETRTGASRDTIGVVMQELLDAYSRPDSQFVDSVTHRPSRTHKRSRSNRRSKSSKRSVSLDPPPSRLLRLEIPNPVLDMSMPLSTTSPQEKRSSLVSPARGSRHKSRRSSMGASLAFSAIPDTPVSVSTMQFGPPRRESGTSSEHTITEDIPAHPPLKDNLLDRLRARPPAAPHSQRPSDTGWKPPW